MKGLGDIRKIDEMGRIVIPKEIRKQLGIQDKDDLQIFSEKRRIIIQKTSQYCILCDSTENLCEVKNQKNLCITCLEELTVDLK